MKKVNDSIRDKVSDLIIANSLTISEFALEKDFIVTEVLHAISQINNDKFDLVFCGGTCLSKAYGLLDRISEGIDIKLVPKNGISLSKNQRKNAISKLKNEVINALVEVGFSERDILHQAGDSNTYVVFTAIYLSHFEISESMRATMKLELNAAELSLPSVSLDIGFLFNKLLGIEDVNRKKILCVNIQEALVEKLVSFPRRLALHLTDPKRFDLDKALVRHLFDVSRIIVADPKHVDLNLLAPLIARTLDNDAKDFASQYPKFLKTPINEITNAMKVAKSEPPYRRMYDDFIKVMVYGTHVPTFDEAINNFETLLMAIIPPIQTNYLHHSPSQ